MPLLINVLGTVERICWALGMEQPRELEELGKNWPCSTSRARPKILPRPWSWGRRCSESSKLDPAGISSPLSAGGAAG